MKRLYNPAVLLAAALQVMPLCRTINLHPAVNSTFAIILRWAVGATAALGAFDSVSGASTVVFTSPTNATGYVGTWFTFTNTLGGTIGSDPGANIAAAPLPAGLTNKTYDLYYANPPNVYSVISGYPTTPTNNMKVTLLATHPSWPGVATTNLYITILTGVPLSITNHPQSRTNVAGTSASFTVGAAGTGPLSYQWRFNGTPIGGATTTLYNLANVQNNHAGSYDVVVTNVANGTTSQVATLTVWVPPAITNQPTSQTNVMGTSASFTVGATGTGPLSYQWRFNGTPIGGATTSLYSLASVQTTSAGSYDVVVTNVANGTTSQVAVLTVTVITNQPVSQNVLAGGDVTFTVGASGAGLSYQWRRNSSDLAGATGTALSLTRVRAAQAGSYTVVVTNTDIAVTSSVASLTVNIPPGPRLNVLPGGLDEFRFSFNPVVGLTNTVQTNSEPAATGWGVLTDIQPPPTTNAIVLTNSIRIDDPACYYRVMFSP